MPYSTETLNSFDLQFGADVKRAMEYAETLSSNLEKRYLDRMNEIKIEKEMKEMRLKDTNVENDRFNADSKGDKLQNSALSTAKDIYKTEEGTLIKYVVYDCLTLYFRVKRCHNYVTISFSDPVIDPKQLYNLMNERCTSFLIIDIRSKQDYSSCRIEYATSINVPEEILQPGRNYLVIRHVI